LWPRFSPASRETLVGLRVTSERPGLSSAGCDLHSILCAPSPRIHEPNIHRITPGGSSRGLIQHQGEEMGFVLEGKIE
jgi:hypothetical protein